MRTFWHGTDYESAMDILNNGLRTDKETVWACSDSDLLYVREEEFGTDSKNDEYELAVESIESGQIAAALKGSTSTGIGVVVINMEDEIAENIVECDDSCENMYGCYQIDIGELNRCIENGTASVGVRIYQNAYNPMFRPFYLSHVSSKYMIIDDEFLFQAVEIAKGSGAYIEELFGFDVSDVIICRGKEKEEDDFELEM